MKKMTLFALAFMLLLAACGSSEESDQQEALENEQETEELADETAENETEREETEGEEAPDEAEEEEQDTAIESNDDENGDKHQEVIDLAYAIFDAQDEKDYDFLESVISEGTTLDKENDTFSFENVAYPHKQEFLTEEDVGEPEFRYTHEEKTDAVIVGFGAINYEEESSIAIDFEFVQEDGKWKMNDMDINK